MNVSYGFDVGVKDLGEWRPGFYSQSRYKSHELDGLASIGLVRRSLRLASSPSSMIVFFRSMLTTQYGPKAKHAHIQPFGFPDNHTVTLLKVLISSIAQVIQSSNIPSSQFSAIRRSKGLALRYRKEKHITAQSVLCLPNSPPWYLRWVLLARAVEDKAPLEVVCVLKALVEDLGNSS